MPLSDSPGDARLLAADEAFRAGRIDADTLMSQIGTIPSGAPSPIRAGVTSPQPVSIFRKVGEAIGDLYSTPFGLTDKQLGDMVNQKPEDYKGLMGTVRTFNRALLQGGSVPIDFAIRTLQIPFLASATAVAVTAENLGMEQGQVRRLFRDINAGGMIAAAAGGGRPLQVSKLLELSRTHTDRAIVSAGIDPASDTGIALSRAARASEETAQQNIGMTEVLPPFQGGLQGEPVLNPQIRRSVEKAFVDSGIPLKEGELISDQIMTAIRSGEAVRNDILSALVREGVTADDLARVFRANITEYARGLGELSGVMRKMRGLEATHSPDLETRMLGWWHRLPNLWRAFVVSAPATAARNAMTATGRVGLDTMNDVIDLTLTAPFRAAGKQGEMMRPLDSYFDTVRFLFKRGTKAQVDEIMDAFPKEMVPLFSRYSADVAPVLGKAEKAAEFLNIFNRTQEFMFRRVKFAATLDTELRRVGTNLDSVIKGNRTDLISTDMIKKGVADALDLTFARAPTSGLGKEYVRVMNNLGVPGLFVDAFSRFTVNSMRFLGEYNPAAVVKLVSSAERAAIAKGDLTTLNKAITGTGLFLLASEIRNSEFAGENWYEVKFGEKTIDTRTIFPFSAYLYAAELTKRFNEGTLFHSGTRQIVEGFTGFQQKVTTGLSALDQMLDSMSNVDKFDRGVRVLSTMGSELASGFLTPFKVLSDVVGEFNREERLVRETRTNPSTINLSPITNAIPFVKQGLLEKQDPTRERTPERKNTLIRQITGLTFVDEKNEVRKELDRLQFEPQEIVRSTGIPAFDETMKLYMGPLVERNLVPIVSSEKYKSLDSDVRSTVMRNSLNEIRKEARKLTILDLAKNGKTAVLKEYYLQQIPRRDRFILEKGAGQ